MSLVAEPPAIHVIGRTISEAVGHRTAAKSTTGCYALAVTAGWYLDESGDNRRFYNGEQWTDLVRPVSDFSHEEEELASAGGLSIGKVDLPSLARAFDIVAPFVDKGHPNCGLYFENKAGSLNYMTDVYAVNIPIVFDGHVGRCAPIETGVHEPPLQGLPGGRAELRNIFAGDRVAQLTSLTNGKQSIIGRLTVEVAWIGAIHANRTIPVEASVAVSSSDIAFVAGWANYPNTPITLDFDRNGLNLFGVQGPISRVQPRDVYSGVNAPVRVVVESKMLAAAIGFVALGSSETPFISLTVQELGKLLLLFVRADSEANRGKDLYEGSRTWMFLVVQREHGQGGTRSPIANDPSSIFRS